MFEIIIPVAFMVIIIISIIVLYFVVIRGEFNAIKNFDVVQEEEVNKTIRNLKTFIQKTGVNFDMRDSSLNSLSSNVVQQESSLKSLNNQSYSLSSSINTLNNQNNSLSSSVNALNNQNNTLSSSVKDLSSQNNTLSSSVNALNSQNNTLSSSVNALNSQNNTLSSSVNSLNSKNTTLNTSLNAIEVEVEELTSFLNINPTTHSLNINNTMNMLGQSLNIAGGLNFANVNDPSNPSYSFQLVPSTGEMKMNMASSTSSLSTKPVQFGIYQNNKPLSTIDSGGKTNYFGNITMSNNACFEMGTGTNKDRDAGKICYQYLSPYDSLDIVGAGTQATGRKIALHDIVTVDAIETSSIKLGNFQFSQNISDGSLQITKISNGASITLFPSAVATSS